MTLGERIIQLRKKQGMKQKDLAKETGIHRGYINYLEHGAQSRYRNPRLSTLTTLAVALRVKTASNLLKGVEVDF